VAASVDLVTLKAVMGRFATGVVVVTALDDEGPVGFTCQSFVSLSLDPPFVSLAPAKSSTSWPRIMRAGRFCANVLSEDQAALAERFSVRDIDRFDGVAWSPTGGGCPLLGGVLAWVECDLELIHDAGDHEFVIGRVRDLGTADGSPLIFYGSGYTRLADA
jgi:3-hydroxy-9,10-secoandrosta-1,3,5(10)-triene-9,17-dione monooxygenase reductase component